MFIATTANPWIVKHPPTWQIAL